MYYMDWNANKCVQDWCGGLTESWNAKFDAKSKYCSEKMSWDKQACNV
jgi:hypothetical protein